LVDTLAVVLGYETTLPVTMEEMLHRQSGARGEKHYSSSTPF